jgi:hypothetical protein
MAFAKTAPDEASFKPLVLGILSVLPIKREFFHRRGSTFVQFKKGKQKMKNVFKFIVLSALLMSFAAICW